MKCGLGNTVGYKAISRKLGLPRGFWLKLFRHRKQMLNLLLPVCHIATPDLTRRRDVMSLLWLRLIINKLGAQSQCGPPGLSSSESAVSNLNPDVSWLQRNYSRMGPVSSKAFYVCVEWGGGRGLSPHHRIKFTEALNNWGSIYFGVWLQRAHTSLRNHLSFREEPRPYRLFLANCGKA